MEELQQLSVVGIAVLGAISTNMVGLLAAMLALAIISSLIFVSAQELLVRRFLNASYVRAWDMSRGRCGRPLSLILRERDLGVSVLALHYKQFCGQLGNLLASVGIQDVEMAITEAKSETGGLKGEVLLALLPQEDVCSFKRRWHSAGDPHPKSEQEIDLRAGILAEYSTKADFALNDLQAYMGTRWIRSTYLWLLAICLALSMFVAAASLQGRDASSSYVLVACALIGILAGITAPLVHRFFEAVIAAR